MVGLVSKYSISFNAQEQAALAEVAFPE